ncbi:MAG: class I SAM-dependent methyltransferase [Pseudomonadota bacterium]|nr:class I SAM-dependent methyltransferase [Pseudomonadota bacterium]
MDTRALIKRLLPTWLLAKYRHVRQARSNRALLVGIPAAARELHIRSAMSSYQHVKLADEDARVHTRIMEAALENYGATWNYYSDALRPEIVQGFIASIDALPSDVAKIDYLEIGSCQGLSMALIGGLLQARGRLGSLTSVDPYFEKGYVENSPYEVSIQVGVDKSTKERAVALYARLSLPVKIIEQTSLDGLRMLIGAGQRFQLVYIDGVHESLWPMVDFGLSCAVIVNGGVLILDDHLWPDVRPIKLLCDTHAKKVQETWKTASYRISNT